MRPLCSRQVVDRPRPSPVPGHSAPGSAHAHTLRGCPRSPAFGEQDPGGEGLQRRSSRQPESLHVLLPRLSWLSVEARAWGSWRPQRSSSSSCRGETEAHREPSRSCLQKPLIWEQSKAQRSQPLLEAQTGARPADSATEMLITAVQVTPLELRLLIPDSETQLLFAVVSVADGFQLAFKCWSAFCKTTLSPEPKMLGHSGLTWICGD